jgi:hypothetical protein
MRITLEGKSEYTAGPTLCVERVLVADSKSAQSESSRAQSIEVPRIRLEPFKLESRFDFA